MVIVAVGKSESGGPGGCRVGSGAWLLVSSSSRALAGPEAAPRAHRGTEGVVAPGRPRGIPGPARRAIL